MTQRYSVGQLLLLVVGGLFEDGGDEGGDVGHVNDTIGVEVAQFYGIGGGAEYVVDEGGDVGHVNWHRSR